MTTPRQKLINWQRAILLALVPLFVAALLLVGARIHALFRYDARYFEEPYLSRYEAPGSVAVALEQALRTGDQELMAEIRGLRRQPRSFEPDPDVILSILSDVEGPYFHYLYFDRRDYTRLIHFMKEVNGRWVEVPDGLYYNIDSGRWVTFFVPLAAVYWMMLVIAYLVLVVYRLTRRDREQLFNPDG